MGFTSHSWQNEEKCPAIRRWDEWSGCEKCMKVNENWLQTQNIMLLSTLYVGINTWYKHALRKWKEESCWGKNDKVAHAGILELEVK